MSICKEFVENFKKLSFELNSISKFNLTQNKYIVGIHDDKTSQSALNFVNDYIRFIGTMIRFKKVMESYNKTNIIDPVSVAEAKTFNEYINLINLTIKQFLTILKQPGKDCMKMNVLNEEVQSIIDGTFKIEPIDTSNLMSLDEVFEECKQENQT